jgi:preprotein translocase subunit SecD
LLLALVALPVALAGCGTGAPPTSEPVDFAFRITYQAVPGDGASPTREEMDAARSITQSRLEETGIAALRVSISEPDRLVVEAGPSSVIEAVRALAGATGRLDFVPMGSTQVTSGDEIDLNRTPPLFSGDQVASAAIGTDQTGQQAIDLVLRDEGRRLLAGYSQDHVGDSIAIVLDGKVLVAPVIQGAIPDGKVQITAGFPLPEFQKLLPILKFGENPFPLREIQVEQQ